MRPKSPTKALRCNNPAGLTRAIGVPAGAAVGLGGELLVFQKPAYGIRALALELQRLEQEQGQGTLSDLVRRWAAVKETDPARYIEAAAKLAGASERALDLRRHTDLRQAVEAIIRGEQGFMPYSDAALVKGLVLAGVEPEQRSLDKSRTLRAAITGVVLLLLAMAAEAVRLSPNGAEAFLRARVPGLLPFFLKMQAHLASIVWAFEGLLLVALCLVIWARLDDWRKGLR